MDGYGGSGKTTLAARLASALPGAQVVSIDDFAAPTVPEWDWDRFHEQVAAPLLAGGAARYQRWDWHLDRGMEWHDVVPSRPVIVEGVSSTRREVRLPWAWTVWVEAPRAVRLDRAASRDGSAMLPRWLDEWMPSEDAYVTRERPLERVDLAVSGIVDAVRVRRDGSGLVACVGERALAWLPDDAVRAAVLPEASGHGLEEMLEAFRVRCPT